MPTVGKDYTITLSENEVGQVLDGPIIRAENWDRTADFLRSGAMPGEAIFTTEECSDPAEADAIASQSRLIINKIESQLEAQA